MASAKNSFLSALRFDFLPANVDLGLLLLRLWLGLTMALNHGWQKVALFQQDPSKSFGDPLGIGATPSLGLTVFAELGASILLILGLFTRFASLTLAITMAVAFFMVHKAALQGPASGELALIYLAGYVTLFLTGPGRFSLDGGKKTPTTRPR